MIELIFLACVANTPNSCEEHAMQYINITPMTCLIGAQPQLAKWTNEHPNWTVKSWKCQHVSQREVRI